MSPFAEGGPLTWNYRVIRQDTTDERSYEIREVYYDTRGDIETYTENPVCPSGETLEELVEDLEHMLADARSHAVLSLTELQGRFPAKGR